MEAARGISRGQGEKASEQADEGIETVACTPLNGTSESTKLGVSPASNFLEGAQH